MVQRQQQLQLLLQQTKRELNYKSMSMVMSTVLNSRAIWLVGGKVLQGSSQQPQRLPGAAAGGQPMLRKAITTAMKSSSSRHMVMEQMRNWEKMSLVSSRVMPCTVAEAATMQQSRKMSRVTSRMNGRLQGVGNGAVG
jgi:hypothetical protein